METKNLVSIDVRLIFQQRVEEGIRIEERARSGKLITTLKMAGMTTNSLFRFRVFHGTRMDDANQHWFACEVAWVVKQVVDHALTWYMKYNTTVTPRMKSTLAKIKQVRLKEFQKPKSESKCITKIKEIKKQPE